MSRPYEESGRSRQKQRTRTELLLAARALIAAGGAAPTVEQAAEAALISRTTAYRYFPSQQALLIAAHPEITLSTLLPEAASEDPEVRLRVAMAAFSALIVDTEDQLRTMLRLSLAEGSRTPDLPLRQGRAIGWFIEALDPLIDQLGAEGVRRLAIAIRSAVGIESLVWLTDIAGLSRPQAVELQLWSATALLRHARATGAPPSNG